MSNVAVITARGGSKRIPRKNIKSFKGTPIIAYPIQTALNCGLFDSVMVSTDDEEIAEVATKYGARVPFMRSDVNADDYAGSAEVMVEVLYHLRERNMNFDYACCLYPTAPLLSPDSLLKAYDLMKSGKFDTVFPVCVFNYPLQRALTIDNGGVATMIWPENLNKRSQDLSPAYHDAGQFYWMNVNAFLQTKKLFSSNSGCIILDELQVQDIDIETDWTMAELKHTLLYKNV